MTNQDPTIAEVKDLLRSSECILIGAGAGLSAAAGIDYTNTDRFRKLFPQMYKLGFRNNYDLMGFRGLPDAVMWGYHAMHVQHVAYENQVHQVYQHLLSLVQDKNYFVMTSNVDRMFHKNGFDPGKIFTPQGDYTRMQCLKPCTDETWSTRPYLDRLLAVLDAESHQITELNAIPSCPNCGGAMFMNVRGGRWFIERPYEDQRKKLSHWIEESMNKKLLVLEFGAGFNTPGVIRYPLERVTYHHSTAKMVRVNQHYPEAPAEIEDRSLSIPVDIGQFLASVIER